MGSVRSTTEINVRRTTDEHVITEYEAPVERELGLLRKLCFRSELSLGDMLHRGKREMGGIYESWERVGREW